MLPKDDVINYLRNDFSINLRISTETCRQFKKEYNLVKYKIHQDLIKCIQYL